MATTTRQHIEMTRFDGSGNMYVLYPKNTLADVYTSDTTGVNIEGKVNFFGTCSTPADAVAKTVAISGFSLVAGAHVTIVFTNGISVANATLNINSTGAKAIYYNGVAIKANRIRANERVQFVYDGSCFHVIAGGANAPYVTNENTTKFYLLGTPVNESGVPTNEHFDTGVYVSAISGQLVARSFSGSGKAITDVNASNINNGTLAVERLATSGATAGSYGPSDNEILTSQGTFTVPHVTVDEYGRITGCSNITYTLPKAVTDVEAPDITVESDVPSTWNTSYGNGIHPIWYDVTNNNITDKPSDYLLGMSVQYLSEVFQILNGQPDQGIYVRSGNGDGFGKWKKLGTEWEGTLAEYNALDNSKLSDDVSYHIIDADDEITAEDIPYYNESDDFVGSIDTVNDALSAIFNGYDEDRNEVYVAKSYYAISATKDGDGNNISETYATKTEMNSKNFIVTSNDGTKLYFAYGDTLPSTAVKGQIFFKKV